MTTYNLTHSPVYDDGSTAGKDQDGALLFSSDYESPPSLGTLLLIKAPKVATPDSVEGSSVVSATGNLGLTVEGWSLGNATHSATATVIHWLEATATVVFSAQAELKESAPIGDTPAVRHPWSPLVDLSPNDRLEVGSLSDLGVNNRVQVLDSVTLQRDPTYSGPDYVLGGPPDDAASPKQLGYKKGEQLLLIGPSGGETHDGRLLTLFDPNGWVVYETLDPLDTTWYQFRMVRSVS